jgi:hypothetical protein
MALEEQSGEHLASLISPPTTKVDHSLDELSKGLASGTLSRRKALRLLGAALVGGALASIPGVGWAAQGGNSACAKFCRENFPPGPERGECISSGARGEGPCFDDGNGGGGCTTQGASCLDEFGGTGICCCGFDPNTGETTNCICCAAAGDQVCGVDVATGEPLCPGTF